VKDFFKNILLNKMSSTTSPKVISILEDIDSLPPDMKEKIFRELFTVGLRNPNKLATVNREFSDIYSYRKKLGTISQSIVPTLREYRKPVDNIVKTIGNISLQKLDQYDPVQLEIREIFTRPLEFDYIYDIDEYLTNKTLKDAKREYKLKTQKTDFVEKRREYEDLWNFRNSDYKNLNFLQKKIKTYKGKCLQYDNTEENRKRIDTFLRLNSKDTYSEYISTLRDLPLGAKVIVGI
jgi:hypothetical protein